MKRYHQIPDIVRDQYKNISDEEAEIRIAEERNRLKTSVQQLVSLIPSNASAPEGKELDVLSMRQSEVKSLSAEASLPFLRDEEPDLDNGDKISADVDGEIFSSKGQIFT